MRKRNGQVFGMGMVAVRNSAHYGILSYYTDKAAAEGLIGASGTNARPSIAPTFSVEPKLGTNPFSWAMTTDEEFPFSFDVATSIVQRDHIELWDRERTKAPEGTVVGAKGFSEPTKSI